MKDWTLCCASDDWHLKAGTTQGRWIGSMGMRQQGGTDAMHEQRHAPLSSRLNEIWGLKGVRKLSSELQETEFPPPPPVKSDPGDLRPQETEFPPPPPHQVGPRPTRPSYKNSLLCVKKCCMCFSTTKAPALSYSHGYYYRMIQTTKSTWARTG
jgi:hypothetical protein